MEHHSAGVQSQNHLKQNGQRAPTAAAAAASSPSRHAKPEAVEKQLKGSLTASAAKPRTNSNTAAAAVKAPDERPPPHSDAAGGCQGPAKEEAGHSPQKQNREVLIGGDTEGCR